MRVLTVWADLDLRVEDDPVDLSGATVRLTYGAHFYPDHRVETLLVDEIIAVAASGHDQGQGCETLVHTDWGPSHAAALSWSRWYHAAALGKAPVQGLRVGLAALTLAAARAGLGRRWCPPVWPRRTCRQA